MKKAKWEERLFWVVIVSIIVGLALIGCSQDQPQPNVKTLVGNWTFSSLSTNGQFKIEEIDGVKYVTSGKFKVNGFDFNITHKQEVVTSKIFLGSDNAWITLLNYSVSDDYNTITAQQFEFDTPTSPTTSKKEVVVIVRK